jgi:hypothetical protein
MNELYLPVSYCGVVLLYATQRGGEIAHEFNTRKENGPPLFFKTSPATTTFKKHENDFPSPTYRDSIVHTPIDASIRDHLSVVSESGHRQFNQLMKGFFPCLMKAFLFWKKEEEEEDSIQV